MSVKFNRGVVLREAATEIENLDLSHKGYGKDAVSINKDLSDEQIGSEILEWAWYIQPSAYSHDFGRQFLLKSDSNSH